MYAINKKYCDIMIIGSDYYVKYKNSKGHSKLYG